MPANGIIAPIPSSSRNEPRMIDIINILFEYSVNYFIYISKSD